MSRFPKLSLSPSLQPFLSLSHFYLRFFNVTPCSTDSKPMKVTKNCTQMCTSSCVDSIKACSSSLPAYWCLQGLWCTRPLHTVVIIMHIYRRIHSKSPQKHPTSHLFTKCVYENKKARLAGLKYQRVFWAPPFTETCCFLLPVMLRLYQTSIAS